MDGVFPLNIALEFHDSEVSSVAIDSSGLKIAFSAAIVHGSRGTPGFSEGVVVLQAVEVLLRGLDGTIETQGCIGKLSDGHVEIQGRREPMLEIPSSKNGAVRLSLCFANGSVLEASGTAIEVNRHGEPRFLEVFRC